LLPFLRTFWRFDKPRLYFIEASKYGGLLANLLWKAGLLALPASQITIDQLKPIGRDDYSWRSIQVSAHTAAIELKDKIDDVIRDAMPEADSSYSTLLRANILKHLSLELVALEELVAYARREWGGGNNRMRIGIISPLVASYAVRSRPGNNWQDITLVSQFAPANTLLYSGMQICFKLARSILPSSYRPSIVEEGKAIGATACWVTDNSKLRDFFWWEATDIPPARLRYLFDRFDVQPTANLVSEAHNIGIASVCINYHARGEVRETYLRKRLPLARAMRTAGIVARLLLRAALADKNSRDFSARLAEDMARYEVLGFQYRALGLGAIWHYQEAGTDYVTAAMHLAGGMRFGTHWSSLDAPIPGSLRTHHVFFSWGHHDARIHLDAGSTSPHLLLAGCIMNEMRSNSQDREFAQATSTNLRDKGARYVLALFDGSNPTSNFFRFFLQWLIDDPSLGLLIKSKKTHWMARYDGLDGLFERALATGRIHAFDVAMWPADVALAADLSIGQQSPSTAIVAALAGARVIYLDYARLDQDPLTSPYATLHSLGSNRCVFYEHETLRQAVLDYFQDPPSNPFLGDASPVLYQFDSFRDGKASQRIGEYVQCYIEGLDNGLSRDNALRHATRSYAEKWGADKVLRGL